MKKKHTPLTNDEVRVIKISEAALYEFIYEKFIDDQDTYLDVDNLSVTDSFYLQAIIQKRLAHFFGYIFGHCKQFEPILCFSCFFECYVHF